MLALGHLGKLIAVAVDVEAFSEVMKFGFELFLGSFVKIPDSFFNLLVIKDIQESLWYKEL